MTAAAGRAFNGFKRKCRDLKVEVDTFNEHLDTITTRETTQAIINHLRKEWGKLSASYE